jgi:flagellin-like hook-associated protein FlgL
MPRNEPSTASPPSVNPDLQAVHTELIAIASDLDTAVGRAKTAAEVRAILDELSEVTARVTALGRQLFTQQTARIRTLSRDVVEAKNDAKKAIKELDNVRSFIQGITKFLGLVDKLIDTAKLVI